MSRFDSIGPEHVRLAIEEHDRIGRQAFLATYGFGAAREYVLRHEGRAYDSKAILGVAHRHATGVALRSDEFSGGRDGAAAVLADLGFEVLPPLRSRASAVNASAVGAEHARATWALAARRLLLDVARRYHAVVTFEELADHVQEFSLIHTDQGMRYWINDVLGRVAAECDERGEPLLSALAVDAHGHVGAAYVNAVEAYRGRAPQDPDEHAAQERLECHRHFGAALPPGGGEPAIPQLRPARPARSGSAGAAGASAGTSTTRGSAGAGPRSTTSRTTSRAASRPPAKPAKVEKPVQLCPVHFTQLPATGVCDLCDD